MRSSAYGAMLVCGLAASVAGISCLPDLAEEATGPLEVASVQVTPESATLVPGESVQLHGSARAADGALVDASLAWSGGDPAIATVSSSGRVSAVAPGQTQISATAGGKTGRAVIDVRSAVIPVASVTVEPASASLEVGSTRQLTATAHAASGAVISGRPVTWSSSSPDKASVSATGLVTAHAAGSSTVSATIEGKSGTSAITVTAPPPPPAAVASISVSPGSASVEVGKTVQLTATLKDAAGNTLTGRTVGWTTSSASVASVSSSGLVTGVGAGSATITATSEGKSGQASITVTAPPPPPPEGSVVLVGAGDIARCSSDKDDATARLLDNIAGTIFTAGDNVYENGTASEFSSCYEPSWGRHKARTRPSAGNHDYGTSGATGYYDYFGASAGPRGKGFYSYELGEWHIVVLNSNISRSPGSEQITWLRSDLAGNTKRCVLAYWHHPRFSSGDHGNDSSVQTFWDVLFEYDADVIVTGHDHNYERFAPQTPLAAADPVRGIRSFVVGTGGTGLRSMSTTRANSEYRNSSNHGVIRFDLSAAGYQWAFITTPDGKVLDTGTGSCH